MDGRAYYGKPRKFHVVNLVYLRFAYSLNTNLFLRLIRIRTIGLKRYSPG